MLLVDGMNSPLEDPLIQNSNCLTLDESNDYKVVSRSYPKFFHYNDPAAPQIDWNSAVVTEKMDGSLAILYGYHGKWHVGSKYSPDGSDEVVMSLDEDKIYYYANRPCYNAWRFFSDDVLKEKQGCAFIGKDDSQPENPNQNAKEKKANNTPDQTTGNTKPKTIHFSALFWKYFHQNGYNLPPVDCGLVFLFDLCSPEQKLIISQGATRQKNVNLILHGIIDQTTIQESEDFLLIAEKFGFNYAPNLSKQQIESLVSCPIKTQKPFPNLQDCVKWSKLIDPSISEGFVVRDKHFNRIKIISPQYTALR